MPDKLSGSLLAILLVLAVTPQFAINMFLPSLGVMAGDFSVDYSQMTWAISGYLFLTAFIQIFAGQAADRFGRRPVLLFCLGLFVVASMGCALSGGFAVFMFFRILQGAVITGWVLTWAIIGDSVGRQKAASVFGYLAMAISLVPIIGPFAGGFLGEYYGWRSNFWLFALMGVSLIILVWYWVPETGSRSDAQDGMFLKNYVRLLGNVRLWSHIMVLAIGLSAFFMFASGFPLLAASVYSFSQFEIGLALGSIAYGHLIGSLLSGLLSTRFTSEVMILSGRILASLGLLVAMGFVLGDGLNLWIFLGGIVIAGIGNGVTNPNAGAYVIHVDRNLAASASGLSGASIFFTGAVFTAVTGYVIESNPSAMALLLLMLSVTLVSLMIAIGIMYAARKQQTK